MLLGPAAGPRAPCGPGPRRARASGRGCAWSTSRRSSSSCVSPGPRRPMPPPTCRDRWVHICFSRGSEYSSWASSTCSRASGVRARVAKMSRISSLRSSTLTLGGLLQVADLGRRQVVVEDDHVGVGGLDQLRRAPRACPCRCRWPRLTSCRFWVSPPTTMAPAVSARPRISSHGSSPTHGRSGRATQTRTAFSRLTENSSRWVSNALPMGVLLVRVPTVTVNGRRHRCNRDSEGTHRVPSSEAGTRCVPDKTTARPNS